MSFFAAAPHTLTLSAKQYQSSTGLSGFPWPAFNPKMSLTKHAWAKLVERVYQR